MLTFGIPADLLLGWGSRNSCGAIGGVLFVVVMALVTGSAVLFECDVMTTHG